MTSWLYRGNCVIHYLSVLEKLTNAVINNDIIYEYMIIFMSCLKWLSCSIDKLAEWDAFLVWCSISRGYIWIFYTINQLYRAKSYEPVVQTIIVFTQTFCHKLDTQHVCDATDALKNVINSIKQEKLNSSTIYTFTHCGREDLWKWAILTPFWRHQSLGYLKKIWMPVVNIHWCPWTLKGFNI